MSLCSGIRADGGRCGAQAITDTDWCFNHHPDYEEQRRRRASKGGKRGGRGRPQVELADIKRRLSNLADGVLAEDVDKGVAAVASQVLNVYLRAVSVEMKVREAEELEARLEEAEEILRQRKEDKWGA